MYIMHWAQQGLLHIIIGGITKYFGVSENR